MIRNKRHFSNRFERAFDVFLVEKLPLSCQCVLTTKRALFVRIQINVSTVRELVLVCMIPHFWATTTTTHATTAGKPVPTCTTVRTKFAGRTYTLNKVRMSKSMITTTCEQTNFNIQLKNITFCSVIISIIVTSKVKEIEYLKLKLNIKQTCTSF